MSFTYLDTDIGSETSGREKSKRSNDKRSRKNKRKRSGKKSNSRVMSQMAGTGIDVRIAVLVPAVEDMPIGVQFAPRLLRLLNPIRVEGSSNTWITLAGKV